MPSLKDRVRVSEDVVFREIDGEAVLLELKTGIYFGLNPVGTRIWSLLTENDSLQRVFETMQAEYEVSAEQLEQDLLNLVGTLLAKGLIFERVPTPA